MKKLTRLFTRNNRIVEDDEPWRFTSVVRRLRGIPSPEKPKKLKSDGEKKSLQTVESRLSIEERICNENSAQTDDNVGRITVATDATEYSEFKLDLSPEILAKANDYRYDKCLGQGQYSTVYRAWNTRHNKPTAVKKVVLTRLSTHELNLCRNEIKLLQAVKSPYVVRLLDNFVENYGEVLCIALELMDGGDLEGQLDYLRGNGRLFGERSVWFYFHQICCGLLALHENRILHRDLKPANVFMSGNGRCKLGDLGMSRMIGNRTKNVRTKCGSAFYMAPEIYGIHGYHFKSDIWSLGCLLYEMCTLCPPFYEQSSEYALCKRITSARRTPLFPPYYSKYIDYFIDKCLQLDSNKRPTIEQCQSAAVKMQQVFQSNITKRQIHR
uniref:Protein kinase domain-containing protein n=1 Tax=Panagrolaimus sp. JU765 TaxID=591449 RepID=A0AC34QC65_9BILA